MCFRMRQGEKLFIGRGLSFQKRLETDIELCWTGIRVKDSVWRAISKPLFERPTRSRKSSNKCCLARNNARIEFSQIFYLRLTDSYFYALFEPKKELIFDLLFEHAILLKNLEIAKARLGLLRKARGFIFRKWSGLLLFIVVMLNRKMAIW